MSSFDNVLQNYSVFTLKKYSGDIPKLLSFKQINESKLSTIEAQGNIISRFSDMESSFKCTFAAELGLMESRLRTQFQSQFASFDFASFEQHIEVTSLKLSPFEEQLGNAGSLPSLALFTSQWERNEKLLNELQPQSAMTQV